MEVQLFRPIKWLVLLIYKLRCGGISTSLTMTAYALKKNKPRHDNPYQRPCFDAHSYLQPQPRVRRSSSLVGVYALKRWAKNFRPMKTFLACFPLIVLPLFADDFSKQVTAVPSRITSNLSMPSSAYRENLAKYLLVTPSELGLMITLPSFEPESAFAIYGAGATTTSLPSLDPDPKPEDIPEDKFFITSTKAKQKIPGTVIPDSSKIEVVRHDLQISKQLAVAIQRAWARCYYAPNTPRHLMRD